MQSGRFVIKYELTNAVVCVTCTVNQVVLAAAMQSVRDMIK